MLGEIQELWEENKLKIIAIVIFVLIGAFFVWTKCVPSKKDNFVYNNKSSVNITLSQNSSLQSNKISGEIYVDVKGEVNRPGVYKTKAGDRLNYVIKQAGGLTKEADSNQINLAYQLTDQMLVYIPKKGEEVNIDSPVLVKNASQSYANSMNSESMNNTSTQTGDKVNLNTATKEELTQLNGIGDKKAEQIIAYRQEHGNFAAIEDLKNVSGIGDKTFEAISDRLTV